MAFRQLTKLGDGFWRAFGGNNEHRRAGLFIDMGDSEKIRP